MNNTLELLLSHRSIRAFTDDPVRPEDVAKAVQCGQQAATSSFIQSYCVINVNVPAERQQFVTITGGQKVVEVAPHFMVVCGDTRRHRLLVKRSGLSYDSHFEGFLLAIIDATLFAQNMVLAFESMGYGTCYIGGVRNDIPAVVQTLELPIGIYPLFGLCVGKPNQEPLPRPRLPLESVLFDNRYPTKDEMLGMIDDFDIEVAAYYQARTGISSTWSEQLSKQFSSPKREKSAIWYQNLGASLE